jgi:hypothetical protein
MGSAANRNTPVKHRSSDRHPMARTLIALFGAPTAWVMQMSLTEPIAAYACYPHEVPLSAPLWVELSLILGTVSLACLAAGLFSGYVAWTLWQYAGGVSGTSAGSSEGGSAGSTAKAATGINGSQGAVVDGGQNHFLAMIGLMSSSLFIIAIIFTCCAIFLVPPCSAWA